MAYRVLNGSHITVLGMMQSMPMHASRKVFLLGLSRRDAMAHFTLIHRNLPF